MNPYVSQDFPDLVVHSVCWHLCQIRKRKPIEFPFIPIKMLRVKLNHPVMVYAIDLYYGLWFDAVYFPDIRNRFSSHRINEQYAANL